MRRGPLYMMFATLAFTVMVALAKIAREELSALEVVCWRGTTSVVLTFWLAKRVGLTVRRPGLLCVRILLGFAAMASFFTAVKGLSLADMGILTKLQPILVALIAPLALGAGERGGWMLAVAVVLGFSGTAVLLGPELAIGSVYGLWALTATVLSAGAHIAVRALGKDHHPEVVVFWFQLGASMLAMLILLAQTGEVPLPPSWLWPHLLGCGVAATVGQVLMTKAYAADPAPMVAAASYVGPLWGVAADLLVFGVWPSVSVWIGGGLVVAAGVMLLSDRPDQEQESKSAQTRA
jgi:S-adenosylmethionine uptake transporter